MLFWVLHSILPGSVRSHHMLTNKDQFIVMVTYIVDMISKIFNKLTEIISFNVGILLAINNLQFRIKS